MRNVVCCVNQRNKSLMVPLPPLHLHQNYQQHHRHQKYLHHPHQKQYHPGHNQQGIILLHQPTMSVSSRSTPSTIKLDYGVDMMEKTTVLVIGVATVIICICICICSAVVWGWRNTAWSYNRIVLDEKIEEADSAEERGMIQMSVQAAWKQCGRDEL